MSEPTSDDRRKFQVTLADAFERAVDEFAYISVDPKVMGGAPCIKGTRIPVYRILDSVREGDSLDYPIRAWPLLTRWQVREALGFAAEVIECALEDVREPQKQSFPKPPATAWVTRERVWDLDKALNWPALAISWLVVTAVPISVIGYAWHASGYEWKAPAAISFVVLTIGAWAIRRAARIW